MGSSSGRELLAVGPAGAPAWMAEAVRAGGGRVVPAERARAVLWADPDDPGGLRRLLDAHGAHIDWVQLPWAGIEPYLGVIDTERCWTCGKGVYAEPVAEMALALALAGMRGLGRYARAARWREAGTLGTNLAGARVTVLGGGGITGSLLRLLTPFRCDVTVVRSRPAAMPGANRVVGPEAMDTSLEERDLVVLALALTPDTRGIIDAGRLRLLTPSSWLVNVARGAHVVTDDLVAALSTGGLGGAGLDVTDPEPLPDGHPLWALPNCIVTPHVGNTPEMARPLLAARITENVARWIAGEPMLGPVDVALGY